MIRSVVRTQRLLRLPSRRISTSVNLNRFKCKGVEIGNIKKSARASFISRNCSTYTIFDSSADTQEQHNKTMELYEAGVDHLNKNEFDDAEYTLLASLEMAQAMIKNGFTDSDWKVTEIKISLALAYTKQALKKTDEAKALYEKNIKKHKEYLSPSQDHGIALMNYSHFLHEEGDIKGAFEIIQEAITELQSIKSDEVLAMAYSNLGTLLYIADQKKESLGAYSTSVKLFLVNLGKTAELTKAAVSNYCNVLSELDMDDELDDFIEKWKEYGEIDEDTFDDEEMEMIKEKLQSKVKAKRRGEPVGFIKDTDFYKQQLLGFVEDWEARGFDIEDPSYSLVLEQELEFLKKGKELSAETVFRESLYLKDLCKHKDEWKENLKHFEDVKAMISEADDKAIENREKKEAAMKLMDKERQIIKTLKTEYVDTLLVRDEQMLMLNEDEIEEPKPTFLDAIVQGHIEKHGVKGAKIIKEAKVTERPFNMAHDYDSLQTRFLEDEQREEEEQGFIDDYVGIFPPNPEDPNTEIGLLPREQSNSGIVLHKEEGKSD